MRGEDDTERLLRLINERRQEMIDRIARGGVSADNVAGGYRDAAGYVKGLDEAEALVRQVLRPETAEPFQATPAKPKPSDY